MPSPLVTTRSDMDTKDTYEIHPEDLQEFATTFFRNQPHEGHWTTPVEKLMLRTEYPVTRGRLYSTSIYWPHPGPHRVTGQPRHDFKWFRENILPHKLIWKFFEPIARRQHEFRGGFHRLYLDERLKPAAFFLMERYGFDQVYLMRVGKEPMREGMLWRYLPMFEPWDEVICTGVDSYKEPLHTGFIEDPMTSAIEAVMVPGRKLCPFAGPIRVKYSELAPYFIHDPDLMPDLIEGFLRVWSQFPERFEGRPNLVKLLHLNRTRNQRKLKITDAVFLTSVFWNRSLLGFGDWSFICDHSHRFAAHEIL